MAHQPGGRRGRRRQGRVAAAGRAYGSRAPLALEALEPRCLLAVITVDTTSDVDTRDSALSLREAIEVANGTLAISKLSTAEQAQVSGALSTPDTIAFNIPGSGVQTIAITRPLPIITDTVIINGYTQPGSHPNDLANGIDAVPLIQITKAPSSTAFDGLDDSAKDSTIEGLVINGFESVELQIDGADNLVEGNFLGTDPLGRSLPVPANSAQGVETIGPNNTIGGTDPSARNLISGNYGGDVVLDTFGGNTVEGNFLGSDISGSEPLAGALSNAGMGILIASPNNTIGGTAAGTGNVINSEARGIELNSSGATGNQLLGNRVGFGPTGTVPVSGTSMGVFVVLGGNTTIGGTAPGAGNMIAAGGGSNGSVDLYIDEPGSTDDVVQGNLMTGAATYGIWLGDSTTGNTIGGTAPGAGNVIDNTGSFGVVVSENLLGSLTGGVVFGDQTMDNAIRGNSITGQTTLGIDITGGTENSYYVTANAPGSPHNGPNLLQSYPVLATASASGGITTITGTLNSAPNSSFNLDFYANTAPSASGYGEGQLYLGSLTSVPTNASGNASFSFAAPGNLGGQYIAATATDPNGNTSEFSLALKATGTAQSATTTTLASSLNPSTTGQPVTFTATVAGTGPLGLTPTGTVTFSINGVAQAPVPVTAVAGNGQATLTVPALPTGLDTLSASYGGDAYFAASSTTSPLAQTVTSNIALAGPPAVTPAGSPVTVTATVTQGSGGTTPLPGAVVTFHVTAGPDLGKTGTATTGANGTASFTFTSSASPGLDSITASFVDGGGFTEVSNIVAAQIQATPVLSWPAPGTIMYGTPLGAAQLNATATVPGTFAYTPAPGTVLHVGAGLVLSVTFTPTDTSDYTSVSTTTTINVTPAPLTITPDNKSKVYGAGLPALTASYSGFVGGDTPANLTTQPTLSTTATASSPVGAYPITASGAADPDYTITNAPGTLAVTPAALTITPDAKSKVYGAGLPALTASYSGFVNGDTPASLTAPPTLATTATAGSPAGSYAITAAAAADSNYTITYAAGTLSVTPASLLIAADSKSIIYGTALPPLTASYSGFVNGDTPASLTAPPTLSTTATASSNVGTYAINVSGAMDSNYTIAYAFGGVSVTPAPLTITADNQSKLYGAALPALTASYSAFVLGQGPSVLGGTLAVTTTATAASHAGNYGITASGLTSTNYAITYAPGVLAVKPAALSITPANASKVYGAALPAFTASYSGFVNGDTPASLATQPALATTATASSPVGSYVITANGALDPDYVITPVVGTLAVTPAPLTVTANDASRPAGQPNPALTASYSGFVLGQGPGVLGGTLSLTTTATTASSPGPYPIVPGGLTSTNYTIDDINGTLTVTPSSVLVSSATTVSPSTSSVIYGQSLTATATVAATGSGEPTPTGTAQFVIDGAAFGPAVTLVGGTATSPPISGLAAGPHTIAVNYSGDTTFAASTATPATVTVTPTALTITANSTSTVYGAGLPALAASYSGFVNGDTPASLTTQPTLATTATALSGVGSYPISVAGAVDGNYTITYASGTLAVTPAALTITADDATKVYGAALPTLSAHYSGFVDGDTPASLTTQPTLATTATASSAVGNDPITASGAVDGNYTIAYSPGTLTVTPASLTITADNKSTVYGAALPALTASYSGFVAGDTPASLTTQPTLATTATAASSVGSYPINVSGAVDANYTITFASGTLAVTPASLTITADNKSPVYGAGLPALTASYSGFVNGDTSASLTSQPTLATTATASSGVGSYPISVAGAADANYAITFAPGTLAVTPAPLTITANSTSKIYGAGLPTLTASYSGFVNGDTPASLATQPTLTTTATASSGAGSYPIGAAGAVDGNYTIAYAAGTLAVTPAALTITANSASRIYGAALPALTASYSGFVNGDTPASLTTQPTLSTTATASSGVGSYPISAAGAVDGNYTIAYSPATLSVTPAPLTIAADNKSTVYGASLPALTASYSGFVAGDTPASLSTPPTLATTATASSSVGSYAISVSGAADANYTITYASGTVSVTPAALTITADGKSKVYGAALPALTAGYSGFVNGDTSASLTTQPTLSTTATASSFVFGYPITASGAVDGNYTITYVPGTLTVTPAPLTITADSKTKEFGPIFPPLAASYSGFVNGDTPASLPIRPTLSTTATGTSAPGAYPITASGAVDANYTISYVAGTMTVNGIVAGDYNGDGKTDLALFDRKPNSSQGVWYVPNVTPAHGTPFGGAKLDVPVQGDFNGDGKFDIAVYRPSTAQWFVGGQPTVTFGMKNVDIPVPGDYDGIGKTQYATYRPTTGQWFIGGDPGSIVINVPGYRPKAGDIPAPADYNGDGKTDEAVYRPGTGQWFIEGQSKPLSFGGAKDIPVPGDYDGVGHAELAVYRPATSQWFVAGSAAFNGVKYGGSGDVPVPGDYDNVGHVQIAVYRSSTGQWYIAGHAKPIQYGGAHFVPVLAPYAYRSIGGGLSIRQAAPAPSIPAGPLALRRLTNDTSINPGVHGH